MERRQLEYFLAVVECGGVTRAATHLHVSQPTISAALHRLERELGGLLFERLPGKFVLTAAGRALVEPANQVIRDFNVAADTAREVLGLGGGHLDICAVPAVAAGWLPPVLATFHAAYPEIGVRVYPETDSQVVADKVRSGLYDLGLAGPSSIDSDLVTHKVGHQDLHAVLPPGTDNGGQPIHVEQLARMDLVTLHGGRSRSRRWLEEELAKRGRRPRIAIELGSVEAIPSLVNAGVGYALWWTPMLVTMVGSCVLRPVRPAFRREFFLLVRRGPLTPAANAFVDAARER